MAKIKVHDLKPTGSELFNDSESFLNDLGSDELEQAMGGCGVHTIVPIRTSPRTIFVPPRTTMTGPVIAL